MKLVIMAKNAFRAASASYREVTKPVDYDDRDRDKGWGMSAPFMERYREIEGRVADYRATEADFRVQAENALHDLIVDMDWAETGSEPTSVREGDEVAEGWFCSYCWMHVPAGWKHDCGGKMKRSRNVAPGPLEHGILSHLPDNRGVSLEDALSKGHEAAQREIDEALAGMRASNAARVAYQNGETQDRVVQLLKDVASGRRRENEAADLLNDMGVDW